MSGTVEEAPSGIREDGDSGDITDSREMIAYTATEMLADLSLAEPDCQKQLSQHYVDTHPQALKTISTWSEHEQVDFVRRLLHSMGHSQLGAVDRYLRPMLQRDFITLLPQQLAEAVLLNVDARELCQCEAVSHSWREALAVGQLWRKLIERKVRGDALWRGLAEKRQWKKYIVRNREAASAEICTTLKKNFAKLRGTYDLQLLQHDFYRELYPRIEEDIKNIERNWRNGNHTLSRINCRSENSKGVYCLQYDDEKIVSGLRDNTIKVWRRDDLSCTKVLTGHTGSVLCLQYDEQVIISGSSDATVRVWDVETGECLNTLIHHCEAVLHLRFANGMMVTCSKDRSIAVWDMISPREMNLRRVLVGHRAAVNVVDFDNTYIVSASGDRTIKVWSANTCEFVRTLTGHKRGIACLQYRGNLVVSGSSDNTIRLWNIHTGACLRVLEGHEELVRCIRFDNKRIVSGAYDGKIKVWDLQAAINPHSLPGTLCLCTLTQHTGRVFRLQFDEFQIVSSSHDDTILIWDFLDAQPGQAGVGGGVGGVAGAGGGAVRIEELGDGDGVVEVGGEGEGEGEGDESDEGEMEEGGGGEALAHRHARHRHRRRAAGAVAGEDDDMAARDASPDLDAA